MASMNRCWSAVISVANLMILILAIIIMCLSLGHWNDYTTCAFTILIALFWTCCVCVENNVAISCYTVLMIIDMLLLLANGIYYSVMTKKYDDFCNEVYGRLDGTPPEWGCHDWRVDGRSRTIGIIVCFFLAFVFRLFNIVGSCLLARDIYQGV